MPKHEKVRTRFRPGVAMLYVIINTKNGEKSVASTMSVRDLCDKPWRTPKGTLKGQEFFKMKMKDSNGDRMVIKFMNSMLHEKCLSADGAWEFTGNRPDGATIPILSNSRRIISKSLRERRLKVNSVDVSDTDTVIEHKVNTEDFCNQEELDRLLS